MLKDRLASICLALACPLLAFAQEASYSAQVPGLRPYDVDLRVMSRAEKDSVMMVADLWNGYVESFASFTAESRRREMWVDGAPDYLMEFDDGNLLYASFRENRIADIRKIGNGVYEIVCTTRSKLPGESYAGWVESVYRVCAMAVARTGGARGVNPFRLCNWLDAVIPTLEKSTWGPLEYYCARGTKVPSHAVVREVRPFVEAMLDEYSILLEEPLRYVVCPTVHDCESMSGFLFNAYSNPMMGSYVPKSSSRDFYGRLFGGNTLMSNYFDDKYDISLLLARKAFPDAPEMMRTGFALFYGGFMNYSYDDLMSCLKKYLEENPDLDLSDEASLYDRYVPVSRDGGQNVIMEPLESLVGAYLVGASARNAGARKIRELLGARAYPELFSILDVPPGGIDAFFRRKTE